MTDPLERLRTALAGRYTLERELGAGGMAVVYLARDVKHDRLVALKVVRPELTALLGPERFLREIAITGRLQHPHILPRASARPSGSWDRTPDKEMRPLIEEARAALANAEAMAKSARR